MTKSIVADTSFGNRIVEWRNSDKLNYALPFPPLDEFPVSDALFSEFMSRRHEELGFYTGAVEPFRPPPEAPEGKKAFWNRALEVWELIPIPPEELPPPPPSITMRQARLALLQAGLLDAVKAAIANMEGSAGEAARIEWEYATTIDRGNALFVQLAAALGLDGTALDALFVTGAAL